VSKQRNQAFIRFAIIGGAVIAAFVLIGVLLTGGGDSTDDDVTDSRVNLTFLPSDYGTGDCAQPGGTPVTSFDDAPQLCIEPGEPLDAVFATSEGEIRVELDTFRTTGTVNNFVNLAQSGYYDGLEVFRTDPVAAVVESGALLNSPDDPGPGYTIPDEGFGFSYDGGELAMSRTNEPDSGGSRFFFTVNENADALNGQGDFVVFGEVTDGIDVLGAILALHEADPGSISSGAPRRTVVIDTVTIEPAG